GLDLFTAVAAAEERVEAAGEGARGVGAAAAGEDARGELVPDLAAPVEEVGRGRGGRGERPVLVLGRLDERDELVREPAEAIGRERGEARERALAEHGGGAADPVEQGVLELLD